MKEEEIQENKDKIDIPVVDEKDVKEVIDINQDEFRKLQGIIVEHNEQISNLKRNLSSYAIENSTLRAKLNTLQTENLLLRSGEENKRLKDKYIKLLGISKALWTYSFEEFIPIGKLVPEKMHLDTFDMR